MELTRESAIGKATEQVADGSFFEKLATLVEWKTESQRPDGLDILIGFLNEELEPRFAAMGFACRLLRTASAPAPFLLAERLEDPALPTVLCYGHGDVVSGQDESWEKGLSPWRLTDREGNWFGRGAADNKGQLLINMSALAAVLAERGRLGFNCKYLVEMGEEIGSPGLRELCTEEAATLAADVLIASDGPRVSRDRATIFLGSRGVLSFDLSINARSQGYHSGNWGGLLSDPAIQLVHALACLSSAKGAITIPQWCPQGIPDTVRKALSGCAIDTSPGDPQIDPDWGEPGLTPVERVYAWSSFSILAFEAGQPHAPVNAIPGRARARCQLRYIAGVSPGDALLALRAKLDDEGFAMVEISTPQETLFPATRLDPEDPWVKWAAASIGSTIGKAPAILPNIGGTIPNDAFSVNLGLPTLWIPHSYPGCRQHGPNEHLPASIAREGIEMMTGLFWDLGSANDGPRPSAKR